MHHTLLQSSMTQLYVPT